MLGKSKKIKQDYEELNRKYSKLFSEKKQLEYELKTLKSEADFMREQDEEIRQLHQNTRKLKHDMKNHLMVLASYLGEGSYDKANNYISEILDKFNNMHSYIETGNSLMNHILNKKLEYARSHHILIKAEIENLGFKRMKAMDFSALLSNLLDNAIEASEQVKGVTPEIHLSIVKRREYETITIKNRVEESVLEKNPELKSTKTEEGHGLGIAQIKSITDEYEGMYDFSEDDDFFCVKVFIPQ